MKDIDHIALESEAALAVGMWHSLRADMRANAEARIEITVRHLEACMARMEQILEGDASGSYPLPCFGRGIH
jgi:hypothetical protein